VEGFYSLYKSLAIRTGEMPARPRLYDVAANTLNMTMGQGQRIIDEVIYDRFSMFPNICHESYDDAEASLKRFVGFIICGRVGKGGGCNPKCECDTS
jgi:hypothetical protein